LWWLIAAMVCAVGVSFAALGLRIDIASGASLFVFGIGYAALACFYSTLRPEPRIAIAIITTGQLFLLLFIGVLLTYAATAVALPYRDAELLMLDRMIGFDRETYRAFTQIHPLFSEALNIAYLTIQPQTALVPLALIVMNQIGRLQVFVMAFGLAIITTAAISIFVPAVSATLFVDVGLENIPALPADIYTHFPTLEALRNGTMGAIDLRNLEGIVTFPSFHTANGILFAWALWKIPYLRIVGLVVNGLMIIATPISGAHYFIDLPAGALVAVAAIWASQKIISQSRQ
jgi:membrane-associated phospholipid phosphatase